MYKLGLKVFQMLLTETLAESNVCVLLYYGPGEPNYVEELIVSLDIHLIKECIVKVSLRTVQ